MSDQKIDPRGKTAFVTGANRGIGRAITIALLENGAQKVYAGARNPETLSQLKSEYEGRLIPVEIDVTKDDTIRKAAEIADDVNILVNNAGVFATGGIFDANVLESLETNLNVNVWGVVRVANSFIKTLKAGGSGAIVNVASVAGLANMPMAGTYSVSKAAVHSITQGMRAELAGEQIAVFGVYPGPVDTEMAAGLPMEKATPEHVANQIIEALKNGTGDVFPDPMALQTQATYSKAPKEVEMQFGTFLSIPA